jgi:hypothetical protein
MTEIIYIPKFINKEIGSEVIKEINHKIIEHNDKKYIVAYTPYKDEHILFVFDTDDKEKICYNSWCYQNDGGYLGRTFYTDNEDNNKKTLCLHNVVMNKLTFEGKG